MPFTVQCDSCRSKFALPDSAYETRIAGKVVDLTCKHCRKNIRIDGTKPRTDVAGASDTERGRAEPQVLPTKRIGAEPEIPSVKPDKRTSGQPTSRPSAQGELDPDLPSLKPGPDEADLPSVKPATAGAGDAHADLPSRKPDAPSDSQQMRAPSPGLKAPTRANLTPQTKSRSSIRVPLPKVSMSSSRSPGMGVASPSGSMPLARTKLVAGADKTPTKAKSSAAPIRIEGSKASSTSDDEFELPTQVLDRELLQSENAAPPTPQRPPPRRSPAMKATMMGVAPPANPRRPPPPLPRRSQAAEPPASQGTALEQKAEPASPLAQTAMVSSPPTFPAGAGSKSKLGGGTMLGLAPPPPGGDFAEENSDRATLEVAKTQMAFGEAAQHSPGLPPERTTPVPPDGAAAPVAGVLELVDDSDPIASPEPPVADDSEVDTSIQPMPSSHLEPTHEPLVAVEPPAAGVESQDAADWDSATSDVSRQIAQSIPNGKPPKRRGRWLLAAMVGLLGGVGGVSFLVVDGRLKLPPAVHELAVRYVPSLQHALQGTAGVAPAEPAPAAEPTPDKPQQLPVMGERESGEQKPALEQAQENAANEVGEPPQATAGLKESGAEAEAQKPAAPAKDTAAEAEDTAGEDTAAANEVAAAALGEVRDDATPAEESSGVDVPAELQPRLAKPVTAVPEGVNVALMQHRVRLRMIRAEQCHQGGRATGDATVLITFGQDGRVVKARVEGEPIASAPVSNCLKTFARSVVLPGFDGEEFTVAYALTLR